MTTHTRIYYRFRRDSVDCEVIEETYTQPLWRWLTARAYQWYWEHDGWLKPYDRWRDSRNKTCCLDHDHDADPDFCHTLPYDVGRDLRFHDLDHAKNVHVSQRVTGTEPLFRAES